MEITMVEAVKANADRPREKRSRAHAIQAERQKHFPPDQRIAPDAERGAQQRKAQPADRRRAQRHQHEMLGEFQMIAHRGETQHRGRKEDGKIGKVAEKEKSIHANSPLKVKSAA
ncbi:MAG: hypothetical protein V8Q79_09680 [Christensenellales bacterium]